LNLEFSKIHNSIATSNGKRPDLHQKFSNYLNELTEICVWGSANNKELLNEFFEQNIHYGLVEYLQLGITEISILILKFFAVYFENCVGARTDTDLQISSDFLSTLTSITMDEHNEDLVSMYLSMLKILSAKLNFEKASLLIQEVSEIANRITKIFFCTQEVFAS
jgi:protein CLEC16A